MIDLLKVHLKHCRGIAELEHTFYLGGGNFAIYAPNGMMKTSFAKTLQDYVNGEESNDRVFPGRKYVRKLVDRQDEPVDRDSLMVVLSSDDTFMHGKPTSTLLVNADLRDKHEQLTKSLVAEKESFISLIRKDTKLKVDFEEEISRSFTVEDENVFLALRTAQLDLNELPKDPFTQIPFRTIFNDDVVGVLGKSEIKGSISEYVERYNKLLDQSPFFHRDNFNHYGADEIAKHLERNGFFKANHELILQPADKANESEPKKIVTKADLVKFVEDERTRISDDEDLRRTLLAVDKALSDKASLRAFSMWIQKNAWIVPYLENPARLRRYFWQANFAAHRKEFDMLLSTHDDIKTQIQEIVDEAAKQSTAWDQVIEIFNTRFEVPFILVAKNKPDAILGTAEPNLEFVFQDQDAETAVDRDTMLAVLSSGETRAFYLLNVLFEIEARRRRDQGTTFIFDDVADSFDYRNKYAIIEYLVEISDRDNFSLIILTHNFDFLRTIRSRNLVKKDNCLLATRHDTSISLSPSPALRNPFADTWRKEFGTDTLNRVASIPFIRNLIEYTRSTNDPDYQALTSLLHWRPNTHEIQNKDLDMIFQRVFSESNASKTPDDKVLDQIFACAKVYLDGHEEVDLAGKVVTAMAARLRAEKHMVEAIDDNAFWEGISSNQMPQLLRRYRRLDTTDDGTLVKIQRVSLLTPEHIHLNAFMYEPLIDVSSRHLRAMYKGILTLS